ncbi:MAG: sugar transferase, partial [Candidatus Zixiibacteriota bacterium]
GREAMRSVSESKHTGYATPGRFRARHDLNGERLTTDDLVSTFSKDISKHSQENIASRGKAWTIARWFAAGSGAYGLLKLTAAVLVLLIIDRLTAIAPGSEAPLNITALIIAVLLLLLYVIPSRDFANVPAWVGSHKALVFLELRFALILTAALFFMSIPVHTPAVGLFLLVNFGTQALLSGVRRKIREAVFRGRQLRHSSKSERNIIIVGASTRGKQVADLLLEDAESNVRLLGFVDFQKRGLWRYRDVPLIGHLGELDRIIAERQVDYAFMAAEPQHFARSQSVFSLLESMGVSICALHGMYEHKTARSTVSAIGRLPITVYRSDRRSRPELLLKEVMDRFGALLGLILSAPILILSVIAIRVDSKGPAFFRQERSGKNGKIFKMYKLRTMVNNAERQKNKFNHLNEMSGPVFKIKEDPRVTRIGKILRKFSIDEFPQFLNILKGDMSLVGPRPPLPREVSQYKPWHRRKLSVKPGATCLWQINGRNEIDFEGWMKLDLDYIDGWSLRKDAEILVKTLPAVLKGRGAS